MRISEGAQAANVIVEGEPGLYRVKDIFTTYQGSWDLGKSVYSPPQWADLDYMTSEERPGGDHHIYIRYDGYENVQAYVRSRDLQHKFTLPLSEKWANQPVNDGYDLQVGPNWEHMVEPNGQVVYAGGLPEWEHVSVFVVWELNPDDTEEPVDPEDAHIDILEPGAIIYIVTHGNDFQLKVTND